MLTVQVNLHTIAKNVATIKKYLHGKTKLCAVVKANAYGLGLVRIGKLLDPIVDCLAVATVAEGVTLRQAGIHKDILILGICDDIATACQYDLIITVENIRQAQWLHQKKLHPRIHLAINTGMNRFGLSSVYEWRATLQLLAYERVEGIYTHLAYEADHSTAVKSALERFQKFVCIAQKYFPKAMLHAGCSGVLNYPAAHFDMIRIGKALYGGIPETQTALTVTSQIIAVRKIKAGSTVGYLGTFTATGMTAVGIVRGGYANGVPMQFGNTIQVLVGKQRCPIIGRICMDYFFIDVSKVTKPLGQTVTLIAPHHGQDLFNIAKQAKMVTCDLLLGFGKKTINLT